MNSIVITTVVAPGVVALLLFLVFTYMHEQSRQPYFRAWQFAWAAYTFRFLLEAWSSVWESKATLISFLASLLLVTMAMCILVSTRLTRRLTTSERREAFRLRGYEMAIAAAGIALALWNMKPHSLQLPFAPGLILDPFDLGVALILGYSSFHFYVAAQRRGSPAFYVLSFSLTFWAVLMVFGFKAPFLRIFGGDLLGPVPQMLLGIAMVMVLFENERNAVQENALAFSTLGVDPMRLLSAEDLAPSMQSILDRLVAPLPTNRAAVCISERWRAVLPSVQSGFSPEFAANLDASGAGEYICELAYRRGGFVTFRSVPEMSEPLPVFPGGRFEQFRRAMAAENIHNVTAVSL